MKKSQVEFAAKKGLPVYSKTGRWIKGWNLNGGYVPNPQFTVDNVIKMRLMTLETINNLFKKGFEVAKEKCRLLGDTGYLALRRGSKEFLFTIDKKEYEEIIAHITKATFAT